MFLLLLKPVSRAEFKYVCIVWIGNKKWEIFTADSQCRVKCHSRPIFKRIFSNFSGAVPITGSLLISGPPQDFSGRFYKRTGLLIRNSRVIHGDPRLLISSLFATPTDPYYTFGLLTSVIIFSIQLVFSSRAGCVYSRPVQKNVRLLHYLPLPHHGNDNKMCSKTCHKAWCLFPQRECRE